MFIAGLFTIVTTWKQPKYPSTEEWIKKKWYIYTMEYCLAMKKNETMSFIALDIPRECHGQHSKSDRERQIYYITYVWNTIVFEAEFHFLETSVFLRPLAYCMRPTHIIEGKLFYVNSTDFTSTHLHNSYMVATSIEQFTVILRILLD